MQDNVGSSASRGGVRTFDAQQCVVSSARSPRAVSLPPSPLAHIWARIAMASCWSLIAADVGHRTPRPFHLFATAPLRPASHTSHAQANCNVYRIYHIVSTSVRRVHTPDSVSRL
jgi:hypothetical protein